MCDLALATPAYVGAAASTATNWLRRMLSGSSTPIGTTAGVTNTTERCSHCICPELSLSARGCHARVVQSFGTVSMGDWMGDSMNWLTKSSYVVGLPMR
jgi:hypothetical protein